MMLNKIIQLLKNKNKNNNSVFDIADVIKDSVPQWVLIKKNEYLGIDFFKVSNIQEDVLTICCKGYLQEMYTVIIKINKNHELYVHDFFLFKE